MYKEKKSVYAPATNFSRSSRIIWTAELRLQSPSAVEAGVLKSLHQVGDSLERPVKKKTAFRLDSLDVGALNVNKQNTVEASIQFL